MFGDFSKKDNGNKKHAYILGGILGTVITFAVMLLFAALLLAFNIDRSYSAPFATISVASGSFAASYLSAKKIGDKGYLTGLTVGFAVFIIITLISVFSGNKLSLNTLFHFVIIMLSSLVGGICGVNKKPKKFI